MNGNIPSGVDMDLINEAIQRRRTGDIRTSPVTSPTQPLTPAPTGVPMTPAGGTAPVGGENPPGSPSTPTPPTGGTQPGTQSPLNEQNILGGLQAGQAIKGNPMVDEETKTISKLLIQKLLKLL